MDGTYPRKPSLHMHHILSRSARTTSSLTPWLARLQFSVEPLLTHYRNSGPRGGCWTDLVPTRRPTRELSHPSRLVRGSYAVSQSCITHIQLAGPHACIAKNLAYQEMRYVLARLLLCYNMTLPEGFDVAGYRNGILNMRTTVLTHKLLVKVERRPGIDLDNPMV